MIMGERVATNLPRSYFHYCKWVSLGLFHPYKWSCFGPLLITTKNPTIDLFFGGLTGTILWEPRFDSRVHMPHFIAFRPHFFRIQASKMAQARARAPERKSIARRTEIIQLGSGNSSIFLNFHPEIWGKWSNLTSICLSWVENTN